MRGGAVSRVLRLARKELREILRDRRTIVTLVLMPVLVYPLLSIAFQRFLVSSLRPPGEVALRLGVKSEEDGKEVRQLLEAGGEVLLNRAQQQAREQAAGNDAAERRDSFHPPRDEPLQFSFYTISDLERGVAEGNVDLAVRLVRRTDLPPLPNGGRLTTYELLAREGDTYSLRLLREVERRMGAVNEFTLQTRLRQLGEAGFVPARNERKLIASAGTHSSASSLKTLVPLILVLMTITGAVYPAIDLTAGERERGTLEMLVAAPVARLELMLGKYLAVLIVALLTATANLAAMSVTIFSMGLGKLVLGEAGLTPLVVIQVFALMALFAAFFSGVLLALTSFARSFKEAQAYLIPLMMLSIAPGLLSLTPDLELNALWAATPLVNIVLLARDLFGGTPVPPLLAAVTVGSTLLFAAAALGLAARVFGTDAILYGSQGNWSDLWRGPAEPRAAASVSGAMLCLALLFPALFVANNSLAQFSEFGLEWQLVLRGVVMIVLFAGFPLVGARLARVDMVSGFALRGAPLAGFLGAAILGLSLWPLAFQIFALSRDWGIATIDEEKVKAVEAWVSAQRTLSPAWIVITFGFLPAISEELFFRGYLFGALRARLGGLGTVAISSILFGLFHLVATDSLAIERLLPTTAIGLALGWVRLTTRSVFPGMLLHAFHNSLLLLVAYYHVELAQWGIGQVEQDYLPWTWLVAGAAAAALAAILIGLFARRSDTDSALLDASVGA
jgi:sodium transport system permease protein